MTILDIENLKVTFRTPYGTIRGARGVNISLAEGETLAIVGESGSGKSVTALATMGLLKGATVEGSIRFGEEELTTLSERQYRKIRGGQIGMIFQDPMTSLNPSMRVGKQIVEGILKHLSVTKKEATQLALDMMERVGIPEATDRFRHYPHQFSGGMRQRLVIAMMLALRPSVIIADEPTTALDVTIQAQILDLLKELQAETGAAILLITHDLGIVAGMADRVAVMYAGQVVEEAPVDDLFERPQHPYTRALLQAVPHMGNSSRELFTIPGSPPSLSQPIKGCAYASRCEYAMRICHDKPPAPKPCACWLFDERASEQRTLYEEAAP